MRRFAILLFGSILSLLFCVRALAADGQIVTDTDTVAVPEGDTADVNVKLSAAPADTVTVNVVRTRGSDNLSLSSGATLTFTTADWDTYQPVTIASATDADADIAVAVFRVSADNWLSTEVSAWQMEAQALLTVQSTPCTAVAISGTPSGVTDYSVVLDVGDDVNLTAPTVWGDNLFADWLDVDGYPLSADNVLDFSITESTIVIATYTTTGSLDFYVNDDTAEPNFAAGDDSHSGLSASAPMRHIQAILDRYPSIGTNCTLHVSDGTYDEHVTLGASHAGLTILGAGRGISTIDGGGSGRPLTCDGFSGTISGFTISGGDADIGGGIYCENNAEVVVQSCAITGCHASQFGGGAACWSSSLDLIDCAITGNISDGSSGGVDAFLGFLYLADDVVSGNSAALDGGAVSACESFDVTEFSTFVGNKTGQTGGALLADLESEVAIADSIVWAYISALGGDQIAMDASTTLYVDYCDVDGGEAGILTPFGADLNWQDGNITADPLFVNAGGWNGSTWTDGDYHLQSRGGHWTTGGWVLDAVDSPCLDAGNADSPYDLEPLPNGGRVNIGAYSNTAQASKTFSYLLTVRSTPITSVAITGTPSGRTEYTSWRAPGSTVTLTATTSVTSGGQTYYFSKWFVGGGAQPTGVTTCSFSMTAAKTAIASYKSVTSLKITGPTTVKEMTTVKYVCTAIFSNGSSSKVTTRARWNDNTVYAKFIAPGTLKVSSVKADYRRRITATYGGKSTYLDITIKNVH